MKRVMKLLKRVRGVSTPFGGVSWGEAADEKHLRFAFSIGFDLHLLQAVAITAAGSSESDSTKSYTGMRILVEESTRRAGFSIDIPESVAGLSAEATADRFQTCIGEISARIQAVKESNILLFSLGAWLADVVACSKIAHSTDPGDMREMLTSLRDRFAGVRDGTRELAASPRIARDLDEIHETVDALASRDSESVAEFDALADRAMGVFQCLKGD